MKLEDIVCSLEYAKQLEKLGVKQDGYFVWYKLKENETENWNIAEKWQIDDAERFEELSAFTSAELGEMLPEIIRTMEYIKKDNLHQNIKHTAWECIHINGGTAFVGETEADARAKMLIYLIEKGLYKP